MGIFSAEQGGGRRGEQKIINQEERKNLVESPRLVTDERGARRGLSEQIGRAPTGTKKHNHMREENAED